MTIKEEKIVMHRTDENGNKVMQFPYVKGDCVETPVPITAGGHGGKTIEEALANLGAYSIFGGELKRGLICRDVADSNLVMSGATGLTDGAFLLLDGKDCNSNSNPGGFILRAVDGTNNCELKGSAGGVLRWDSKKVATNGALSMPSSRSISVSIGSSGSSYKAPCDGWLSVLGNVGGNGYFYAFNDTANIRGGFMHRNGGTCNAYVPCSKGDTITYSYSDTPSAIIFVYANSEV